MREGPGFMVTAHCRHLAGVWVADIPALPGIRPTCALLVELPEVIERAVADELGIERGHLLVRLRFDGASRR